MKRILMASVGLLALSFAAQPVLAADLPTKAPAYMGPVAAPMFNWTGFYVGGTVGYGWGKSEQFAPSVAASTGEYDIDGFVAGGTVGYNWQTGPWVFGLEADLSYSGIDGATSSSGTWNCVVPNGCVTDVDWFSTGRVRAGYATNNWLAYLTGGIAFGDVQARTWQRCSHRLDRRRRRRICLCAELECEARVSLRRSGRFRFL